jgi:hypothetical protein
MPMAMGKRPTGYQRLPARDGRIFLAKPDPRPYLPTTALFGLGGLCLILRRCRIRRSPM